MRRCALTTGRSLDSWAMEGILRCISHNHNVAVLLPLRAPLRLIYQHPPPNRFGLLLDEFLTVSTLQTCNSTSSSWRSSARDPTVQVAWSPGLPFSRPDSASPRPDSILCSQCSQPFGVFYVWCCEKMRKMMREKDELGTWAW